jgi:O-antigen/teichoic acid export membrane protein
VSRDRHITTSSLVVLVATAVGSVLGYGFWLLLARGADPEVVGAAGTLVSVVAGISLITTAGIVPTLLVEVPGAQPRRRGELVGTALVSVLLLGAGLAGLVLLLPMGAGAFGEVRGDFAAGASFVLAAALTPVGAVLDACHVAVRRSRGVLIRVGVTSALRVGAIATLVLVSRALPLAFVLILWAAGLLAGVVPALWSIRRHVGAPGRLSLAVLIDLRRRLGWNQLATVAAQLPAALFPLIVAAELGSAGTAGFYIAWQLAGGCFMVTAAVTPSMLSASASPDVLRRSVRLTGALLLPAVVATLVLGAPVLGWLGPEYRAAYPVLVVFVAAALPDAATSLLVAHWRRGRRERRAALLNAFMAFVTILGSWLLVGPLGAVGVAWAFLLAQAMGTGAGVLFGVRLPATRTGQSLLPVDSH